MHRKVLLPLMLLVCVSTQGCKEESPYEGLEQLFNRQPSIDEVRERLRGYIDGVSEVIVKHVEELELKIDEMDAKFNAHLDTLSKSLTDTETRIYKAIEELGSRVTGLEERVKKIEEEQARSEFVIPQNVTNNDALPTPTN